MKKRTKSSGCKPRRVGDGTRRMVGDLKQGRSRARKAPRTSRKDEAWGGSETDGSGRSSGDAEGPHNPGGAKDPWGSGVLSRSEDRPDMPRANGKQPSSSRTSTHGASNPATGKGVSEERSVPRSWSRPRETPPHGILEGRKKHECPACASPQRWSDRRWFACGALPLYSTGGLPGIELGIPSAEECDTSTGNDSPSGRPGLQLCRGCGHSKLLGSIITMLLWLLK